MSKNLLKLAQLKLAVDKIRFTEIQNLSIEKDNLFKIVSKKVFYIVKRENFETDKKTIIFNFIYVGCGHKLIELK